MVDALDDFDWSGFGGDEQTSPDEPAPAVAEPAPARPKPSPYDQYDIDVEKLPKAYREYKGDTFKKRKRPAQLDMSLDEIYGGSDGAVQASPADSDDWAFTRGVKEAYRGGNESMATIGDMGRIALLPAEQQAAAMLELANKPKRKSLIQEPGIENIGGLGEFFTWLGESSGQMLGSMGSAAMGGGVAGAASGGALGMGGGPLGIAAGAIAGGGYGTLASFGAMGVGGMFNDLLADEGVKKGLADGTVSPGEIFAWATGAGAAIGLLDILPVARIGKRVTGDVAESAIKTSIRRAALKGALKSGFEEGVTEAGQGAISELGQAITGGDMKAAERALSVINQGLAGAVGGGGPGAIAGVIQNAKIPETANPANPSTTGPLAQPGGMAPGYTPADTAGPQPQGAGGQGQRPAPPAGGGPKPRKDYGKPGASAGTATVGATDANGIDETLMAGLGEANGTPANEAFDSEEGLEADDEIMMDNAAPAGVGDITRMKKPPSATGDAALDEALKRTQETPVSPAGAPASAAEATPSPTVAPQTPLPAGEGAPPIVEEEGGIPRWQDEFNNDPYIALNRMAPDDVRRPEVQAWVDAKIAAAASKYQPPVSEDQQSGFIEEAAPQEEVVEEAPVRKGRPKREPYRPGPGEYLQTQVEEDVEEVADPDAVVATYTTAKGSTYEVHADGTTTRNKAYRPEHGEKEQGPQPRSHKTYYVTPESANVLAEIQAEHPDGRAIVHERGRLGMLYTSGKNQGRVEKRTIVNAEQGPAEGLIPLELWEDGRVHHFGNAITQVGKPKKAAKAKAKKAAPPKKAPPKAQQAKEVSKAKQRRKTTETKRPPKVKELPPEVVAEPEPEVVAEPEKAKAARRAPTKTRLRNFAAGVNKAVKEEDEARAEMAETHKPPKKGKEEPTSYKHKSGAPTARKAKLRAARELKEKLRLKKAKAARERVASAAPLTRVAMADLLARYDELDAQDREHLVAALTPAAKARLEAALEKRGTPAAEEEQTADESATPTQREPLKPKAPTHRRFRKAAASITAADAVTVTPEVSPIQRVKLNITGAIFDNMVSAMKSVQAAVDRLKGSTVINKKTRKRAGVVEDVTFTGKVPKLAKAPPRPKFTFKGKTYTSIADFEKDTAVAGDAVKHGRLTRRRSELKKEIGELIEEVDQWGDSKEFKKLDRELKKVETALAELDAKLKPARDARNGKGYTNLRRWETSWLKRPTPKGEKVDAGLIKISSLEEPISREELFDKYLIELETETRRSQIQELPVERSQRDRAVEAMRDHFAKSKRPVRLKPLKFTKAEIKLFESLDMAVDGTMDETEFNRWQQSEKGANVPEGIGPKPTTEAKPVQQEPKYPIVKVPENEANKAFEKKKAEPFKRRIAKARAWSERKIAEVTAAAAGRVEAGKTGRSAPSGKPVPVTARSDQADPTSETIPQRKSGWKGDVFRRKKQLESEQGRKPVNLIEPVNEETNPDLFREVEYKPSELEQRGDERVEVLAKEIELALPLELKRLGVTVDLTQKQLEDVSQEAAAEIEPQLQKWMPPLMAVSKFFKAQLAKAAAAYKAGNDAALDALAEERAVAEREAEREKLAKAEAKTSLTSPTTGKRRSEKMAKELPQTIRRIAQREMEKPEGERSPELVRIHELWEAIIPTRQNPEYKKVNAQRRLRIKELQAVRVAKQVAAEKSHEQATRIYELNKKGVQDSLDRDMEEWRQRGALEQEIEDYVVSQKEIGKRKERVKRALATTKIIQKTLADYAPPLGISHNRGIMGDQDFVQAIRDWAEAWTQATRQALAAAGQTIGNKVSRVDKTPEENALIYVEQILKDYDKAERLRVQGRTGKGASNTDKVTVLSAKQIMQRGQGLIDAWSAMQFIKPLSTKLTGLDRRLLKMANEAALYGSIIDASSTKAARSASANITDEEIANKQMELMAREAESAGRMDEDPEQLGDLGRIMREKGFGSQPSTEQLPLGQDAETLTAAEAVDKYMRGWRARSKQAGWQNLMRRALMKSLKKLVGHTPVHFVDASVIASHSKAGEQRHGMFVREKGKSFILLDKGLKGRPRLLDEILLHEMSHAATAYAIDTDLRGTRGVIRDLMNSLQKTLRDGALTQDEAYAFENEHEFLAMALNNAQVQEMMSSLQVPLGVRASIRALGKGRAMPTYWDIMVAAVQRAIGVFTPGRAGTTYMDQLLKIYPHVALSSSEQQADAAIRLKGKEIEDINLGAPFSMSGIMDTVKGMVAKNAGDRGNAWHKALNVSGLTPTNSIVRRVADKAFGGIMQNPFTDLASEMETLPTEIEELMREGDVIDTETRRWMMENPRERREVIAEWHDLSTNMSIDGVDGTKSLADNTWIWDDANHPVTKKRLIPSLKHVLDSGKRAAHVRYKARWDALNAPPHIKALLAKRQELMNKQMEAFERGQVEHTIARLLDTKNSKYNLPPGMSRGDAVREIMDGKMSPELKVALGKNAKTIEAMGKYSRRGQPYTPAFRSGKFFISGRRNIATPETKHGTVLFDDLAHSERGIFRWVFNDLRDATAYIIKMGQTGEERVLKRQRKYIDPRDGTLVSHDFQDFDAAGKEYRAQEIYYVTMQDRFMAMSDSVNELHALRKDLLTNNPGEYHEHSISKPILMSKHREAGDNVPLALSTMINNINSQQGASDMEKAIAIDMATNHFIKTQQGNRVTKHMVRRDGVAGFATGADEYFRSTHGNNEMMSRAKVAINRLPRIAKLQSEIGLILDAMRYGGPEQLSKIHPRFRPAIKREYDKGENRALRLSEDVRELTDRLNGTLTPSPKFGFEGSLRAMQAVATLKYLGTPVYFGIQSLSLLISTVPNMQSEFFKMEGIGGLTMALRYLGKGLANVGIVDVLGKSLVEAAAEAGHVVKGFAPRQDYLREGRATRRAFDYRQYLKDKIDRSGTRYASAMKKALDYSYARQALVSAGLDQPNLRMDLQQPGIKQKAYRGIESGTRVFRALQEGIELINRAAPLLGYVEYYLDKGLSEEEAIRKAHSNMVKEQVNYSKTNWARWVGHPVFGAPFMFKKYAAQMGFAYYESLMRAFDPRDKTEQQAAWVHLGSMAVIMTVLGGFVGNPLWEPIRYLMYWLGKTRDWDETKTNGEKRVTDMLGGGWLAGRVTETAMYGAPRLLGIDISNRVALDSLLFYRQPTEMSKEGWWSSVGQFVGGAMGATVFDTVAQTHGLWTGATDDQSWSKWASRLPIPGFAANILKTYDLMAHGPTTATGVSTGEPIGVLDGLIGMTGLRTRKQARVFEQGSAAKHRTKEYAQSDKATLIRRINANGRWSPESRAAIREWNKTHKEKDYRINSKSLSRARDRRRETERDIAKENRAGL